MHLIESRQVAHGVDLAHHALHKARIYALVVDFEAGLVQECNALFEVDKLLVRIKELCEKCSEDLVIFEEDLVDFWCV